MNILMLEWYPYIDKKRLDRYISPEKHKIYTLEESFEDEDIEVLMARGNYPVDAILLDRFPNTKYALRVGVGIDNFDKAACAERNVEIINRPWSNAKSVAELAVRGLLWILRRSQSAYQYIKTNKDIPNRSDYLANEVTSQTIGFIWAGNISQEIMKRIIWFEPKQLLFFDPYIDSTEYDVRKVEHMEDIFTRSDCIFVGVPLLESTKHTIRKEHLDLCKSHVKIVNVSRWWIVHEVDLETFLSSHPEAGFYGDVRENEPTYTHELDALLKLDNFTMTPHMCAETEEAQDRMHYFELLAT